MQYQDNLGAEKVALSAAELTELDKFTEPTPLYPNWFQAFATDTAVRDALDISKTC